MLPQVSDMREEGVLQPLLVTQSAVTLATECVRMILKVRLAAFLLPRAASLQLSVGSMIVQRPSSSM